jgi:hypothetical protein
MEASLLRVSGTLGLFGLNAALLDETGSRQARDRTGFALSRLPRAAAWLSSDLTELQMRADGRDCCLGAAGPSLSGGRSCGMEPRARRKKRCRATLSRRASDCLERNTA